MHHFTISKQRLHHLVPLSHTHSFTQDHQLDKHAITFRSQIKYDVPLLYGWWGGTAQTAGVRLLGQRQQRRRTTPPSRSHLQRLMIFLPLHTHSFLGTIIIIIIISEEPLCASSSTDIASPCSRYREVAHQRLNLLHNTN